MSMVYTQHVRIDRRSNDLSRKGGTSSLSSATPILCPVCIILILNNQDSHHHDGYIGQEKCGGVRGPVGEARIHHLHWRHREPPPSLVSPKPCKTQTSLQEQNDRLMHIHKLGFVTLFLSLPRSRIDSDTFTPDFCITPLRTPTSIDKAYFFTGRFFPRSCVTEILHRHADKQPGREPLLHR